MVSHSLAAILRAYQSELNQNGFHEAIPKWRGRSGGGCGVAGGEQKIVAGKIARPSSVVHTS